MKTINTFKTVLIFCILTLVTACSDDVENNSSNSRNVKYEITGNATGTFDATYITGSGSGANEIPSSLPWSKDIVLQASVTGVSINAAVIGATPGKNITAKIFVGGVMKKEQTAVVQTNGIAIISGLNYTLN